MWRDPRAEAEIPSVDPLIGSGHGIDHLIIVVKDLSATSQDFQERLGFKVDPVGRFANGAENAEFILEDQTYVELLALQDQHRASPGAEEIRRFLSKGEGAGGFGIKVSSAEGAAAHLREEDTPWKDRRLVRSRTQALGRILRFFSGTLR